MYFLLLLTDQNSQQDQNLGEDPLHKKLLPILGSISGVFMPKSTFYKVRGHTHTLLFLSYDLKTQHHNHNSFDGRKYTWETVTVPQPITSNLFTCHNTSDWQSLNSSSPLLLLILPNPFLPPPRPHPIT